MSHLTARQLQKVNFALNEMIINGGRIIAIAKYSSKKHFDSLDEITQPLEFMGLIELADPLRSEAKAAVRQAHQAGIKVVMITGDHYKTALSIGRQLGIVSQ